MFLKTNFKPHENPAFADLQWFNVSHHCSDLQVQQSSFSDPTSHEDIYNYSATYKKLCYLSILKNVSYFTVLEVTV